MNYIDKVYGEFEINEPVILELINSSTLQRLKSIDQAGYRALWVNPEAKIEDIDNSRFSHSLGVYILLNKFGASLEEQIAGLIHDVSHTAFSHCTEYVLNVGNEHKQDHQDSTFDSFVKKSEIPEILEKYGFGLEYILDDKNFPLKEKDLPDICADRIDYSLRTAVLFEEISSKKVEEILDNLENDGKNWFFRDFENAKEYAGLFSRINDIYFSDFDSARMYEGVRGFVSYAMQKKYIDEADLYTDDKKVVAKICLNLKNDPKLQKLWGRMNDKNKIIQDTENYDKVVNCKSRVIDPSFRKENLLVKVSEQDLYWGKIVKKKMKPVKHFLRFDN